RRVGFTFWSFGFSRFGPLPFTGLFGFFCVVFIGGLFFATGSILFARFLRTFGLILAGCVGAFVFLLVFRLLAVRIASLLCLIGRLIAFLGRRLIRFLLVLLGLFFLILDNLLERFGIVGSV